MRRKVDTKKFEKFIKSDNIAELLEENELSTVASKVKTGYDLDLDSRSDTDKINEEALKLAKQTFEEKSTPWPGAANVKYPLITVASIQFASRAYPELVQDESVVNAKIVGADEDGEKEKRAKRVTNYMDYQLTEDIDGWLDGTDRLLHALPIVGTCYRKIYFDGLMKKVAADFLTYSEVVVNAKAKNMKSARRVTHKIYKYKNYALEMYAEGLWSECDLDAQDSDTDAPHLFLEQHRWLDLDEDGYEEPYIVTMHNETNKIVRIVARYDVDSLVLKAGALVRIEPTQYFVKYPFIPNPEGGFYDIGFGSLLYPINESINTVVNQLLDAGTLATSGGGFLARGIKLNSGAVRFKPGEWKPTDVMGGDLKAGIMPLPIREPSQVLFSLLGLLITAGKDISSVQEAMSGQKPGENVSAATVATLIEQGLKVFSGIYKRVFRAMSEEFKLIYKLNATFLEEEEYVAVLDEKVTRGDFNTKDHNIFPSADPLFSLDMQRIGKAEAMLKVSGRQGINEDKVTNMYIKAVKAPSDTFIPPDQRPQPPPTLEAEELRLKREEFEFKKEQAKYERMKTFAQIEDLRAKALLQIAKAEAEEEGVNLEGYKLFLEDLGKQVDLMRGGNDQEAGVRGMERAPGNESGIPGVGGAEGQRV